MEFNYLAALTISSRQLEKKVNVQAMKTNRVVCCKNDSEWNNKSLTRDTKTRI